MIDRLANEAGAPAGSDKIPQTALVSLGEAGEKECETKAGRSPLLQEERMGYIDHDGQERQP
ncbi:hypothetical protein ASE23_22640 [Rhizobium sp. Root73]|nr:hypothetical protein ASD36_22035 [Rhizobium sp. Root1334]KRC11282.1 hypothetical protein ASE23_22640 [Rhizobium sp. Root73]